MRRLCGPTFARYPDENSEAVSIWWSEDFPARTSATQARAQDSKAHAAACSSTSSQPFATYDPATCSWKTSQHSLFEDSTPFSGRWPKSGLMLAGAVYERPTLARLMAATAGGASRGTENEWPTVTATHWARNKTSGRSNPASQHHDGVTLADAVAMWPTPSVADTIGGHLSRGGGRSDELLLPGMAQRVTQQWATPTTRDWKDGACEDTNVPTNALLGSQSVRWPTPRAEDSESTDQSLKRRAEGRSPEHLEPAARALTDSLSGPLAQPIAGSGHPFSLGGRTLRPQLSALFVEWLMLGAQGIGWTCICPAYVTEVTD